MDAFLVSLAGLYLLLNFGYAVLLALRPGSVHGTRPGSLLDAFFFSIETMSTVGFGEMYPATFYGHVIVTVDVVTGVALGAARHRPDDRQIHSAGRARDVQPQRGG